MHRSTHRAVVLGVARTAFGSFGGSLASVSLGDLAGAAAAGAVARAGVAPEEVGCLLLGNVLGAAVGQAPARQAALAAGLDHGCVTMVVNKVCASGLKAVALAAQQVAAGEHAAVVAVGAESMSRVPYYATGSRWGTRLGHADLADGLVLDGLWCASHDVHMGELCERVAERLGISRAAQDAHAAESYERALSAQASGALAREIVPVEVPSREGAPRAVDVDEEPSRFGGIDALHKLRTAFRPEGTVTAGNASTLADGAAAVLVASEEFAAERGLRPLAVVRGCADAELAPEEYPLAPAAALPIALERAGVALADLGALEVNEAFSAVDLANRHALGLDGARVNVHGGAVSLGHPIGASGARLVVSLLSVLEARDDALGAAAICNGGGGATALVLERI